MLIANKKSGHKLMVEKIRKRIEGYITATKFVMISYNVHNDLLDACMKITPGKKSPNITALDDNDYKAVSCLVEKNKLVAKMDELHDTGATDILTFELANTRM